MCKSEKTGKWYFWHCWHRTGRWEIEKSCEDEKEKRTTGYEIFVCCRCGTEKA